jgi:hypothetical protein
MATLIRFIFTVCISALAYGAEPIPAERDSLLSDTTLSIQMDDSTVSQSHSSTSNWLLPLSVIGATAGLFLILFTARSK